MIKIKLRKANYEYYGMTDEQVRNLLKHCRDDITKKEEELLLESCETANCYIADILFCSIRYGMSYNNLVNKNIEVSYSMVDFYAYRRKALKLFNDKLKGLING